MNKFNVLIDTNVIIGLEDAQPVHASFAELVRLTGAYNVGLFVESANYDDVARDRDLSRRAITLSKLEKFQRLAELQIPSVAELISRFGPIRNQNDLSDVRLLQAVDAKAVDFLVTQDIGIHRRASRAGIGSSVLTIEDALGWLRRTFQDRPVDLPNVAEKKAYQIDRRDSIFVSLQQDYAGFSDWFEKCRRQHRDCWVLDVGGEIAGLVIRKDETYEEAQTQSFAHKILKICTFKVRDEFRGEKFGELLLKQILWFAQSNKYGLVYLTAFPKQTFLRDLLQYFGFEETKTLPSGELMLEKVMLDGRLPADVPDCFAFSRKSYPRFFDGPSVRKYCVPIIPAYHRKLFPEIAFASELPLFPKAKFGPQLRREEAKASGNTIRKVYLCRAKIGRLRPGDILLFYMSKDVTYLSSQSVTTLAVLEKVTDATSLDELIRLTAKRSVFSAAELEGMQATAQSPVKVIDFLLVGHFETPINLDTLCSHDVFSGRPPQSIATIREKPYVALRTNFRLGFE